MIRSSPTPDLNLDWAALQQEAVGIVQNLIRFDTTNPPGHERAAAEYLADLLRREGIEPTILGRTPERPNVLARLPGRGERGPLLLQGHLDVVLADHSEWSVDPFAGILRDGFIYGRGAVDMKGPLAMELLAFLVAHRRGWRPAGDVVFAAVADEEAGGDEGARWLVDHHPEQVRAEVILGELGGFNVRVGEAEVYAIQVAEKALCQFRITLHGPSGHGSLPIRDGAMAKLGRVLTKISQARLPLHLTPAAEGYVRGLAAAMPPDEGEALLRLLEPNAPADILQKYGPDGRTIEAALFNTVSPTVVQGGEKVNVIPGTVTLSVDGRLVPGQQPEDLLDELAAVLNEDVEIDILRTEPQPLLDIGPDYEWLAETLRALDPQARPAPYLLSATTDGRIFQLLGGRSYGFTPMKLPPGVSFPSLGFHGKDERIPVDGLGFGIQALSRAVATY